MTMPFPLTPKPIHVDQAVLDDVRARLRLTRLPADLGNEDSSYGVSRNVVEGLIDHWLHHYDWREAESAINAYEHYQVSVDGVPVHFMRRPGVGDRPIPLILTHGWPWTFWHWSKVVDPLADPAAFGADPADAFEVIVPCLPGFGFSTPLRGHPDMNFWKAADLWHTLMTDVLGHTRYAAGGCDIGALVSGQLGHKYADSLYGIHIGSGLRLDFFNGDRAWDLTRGIPLPENVPQDIRDGIIAVERRNAVHLSAHMLDSSTLAHAFTDSPAGLLAWLLKRWTAWSDSHGDVENVFSKDDILTHTMIYWVNGAIGTSMRYYANANRHPWTPSHDRQPVVQAPTGLTFVAHENPPGTTTAERVGTWLATDRADWYNHTHLTAHDSGGHFIPWEVPHAWTGDLRRTFRTHR